MFDIFFINDRFSVLTAEIELPLQFKEGSNLFLNIYI